MTALLPHRRLDAGLDEADGSGEHDGVSAGGAPDRGPALFTPPFVTLAAADLAYFTAFGLMIPVVPLFVRGPLEAGPIGVGVAVGVFSISALVLRPFAGRWSDLHGRRPLIVGGALAFAIVSAAHVVAFDLGTLLVLRALLGAAEAAFFVAGVAALADLSPQQRLAEALSYNSFSLYLGIALGPSLGELLLRVGGYRLAWAGAALPATAAAVLAVRLPETARPADDSEQARPLLHRALLAPGLTFVTGLAASAGFLGFAALHARQLGMASIAPVMTVYGLLVIGGRLLLARVSDRVPPLRLGSVALLLCSAGMALTSALHSPVGLTSGAAVLAFGTALLTPAFYKAMMLRVNPSQRGGAAGTFSIFVDLGLGGGPIALGLVAGAAGIPAAFAAAALLAGLGAVMSLVLARTMHPPDQPPAASRRRERPG